MRRLFLAGGAGRTGGDGETRFVEADDPLQLAVAFGHERGNRVPQTRHVRAENARAGQRAQQFALKIIAPHAAQQMLAAGNLFLAHFQRGHHRGDDRHVFRARAPAAFLLAAVEQRSDGAAMRNFQKAHAARSAEFVRRAADKITVAQSFQRHLADELHGVGEKRHFVSLADRVDFAPRLNDAGLIVCGHHADEAGAFVGQFRREPVHVHHAIARDGNQFGAFPKIMFRRIVNARMFDGGNPDLVRRAERFWRNDASPCCSPRSRRSSK